MTGVDSFYLITKLIPRSRVLLEKLIVAQLVKKFPDFMEPDVERCSPVEQIYFPNAFFVFSSVVDTNPLLQS
jgi:hypothetical protein